MRWRRSSSCLPATRAAAERAARHSCDDLERRGEKGLLSTTVAELAETLVAQGRYAEAERLSERSEELGASDDVVTQSLWRRVRAKVLARRHETEQSIRLAREAVEIMPRDQLSFAADARMDLADVLALGGIVRRPRARSGRRSRSTRRRGTSSRRSARASGSRS